MIVQFLKDTARAKLESVPPDTLMIYREGYNLPGISGIERMDFERFKVVYSELHFNMLIIVGLNRMITPSNRCDMVNDFLQTMTRNIPKVSIDSQPFIGEPWRVWYHYDVTNTGKFGVPHGYAIETEWKHWFYRESNHCRLSRDNIRMLINNTYSDLELLTTNFEFYEAEDHQLEWYNEAKEHIFSKYDTPKMLVNNLLKLSNRQFQADVSFDSFRTNRNFVLPDLGIYRFMADENKRRMDIYNAVIK